VRRWILATDGGRAEVQSSPDQAWAELGGDDVHIWIGSLRRGPAGLAALASLLNAEELTRTRALPSPTDRRRFLVSRGELRLLLGRYLGTAPGAVRLTRLANGKPIVTSSAGRAPLHFSLSHSGDQVLYAVTRTAEVGADVQRFRTDVDWRGLASRFFAPAEAIRLHSAERASGRPGFYRLWTRKEAMAKADGRSLFWWLSTDLSSDPTPGWRLWTWRLPAGAASVALRMPGWAG
jgi:4'-phosphopantetheinyl transferase